MHRWNQPNSRAARQTQQRRQACGLGGQPRELQHRGVLPLLHRPAADLLHLPLKPVSRDDSLRPSLPLALPASLAQKALDLPSLRLYSI